ncbi:hypothetical protein KEH51_17225 [[Brevibacterium] frigoritolerans]|uniref:Condensation domain-containing protein n=1 Tax=Peribacillus frigoritolerans TaxID=450367 RepID=A0A941J835_9BACI|nr:hypothetical protein [Peribacillus frigoritolerans]
MCRTVGCFVNTLPLKLTVDPSESFHEILNRNRKVILDVLEHQAFPFEKIVEIINPDRISVIPHCSKQLWQWKKALMGTLATHSSLLKKTNSKFLIQIMT